MAELDQLAHQSRRLQQETAWLRRRSREAIARSRRVCLQADALIALDERYRAEAERRYGPDERHRPCTRQLPD
jgi:hypothetical protein